MSLTARAALILRGNGMVYDDVMHITWLQDALYAKTSGYSSYGGIDWTTADSWVQTITVGGYNDWRLPTPAEFSNLYTQTL